jgi:multiple sugar transport system ATP-binding protein
LACRAPGEDVVAGRRQPDRQGAGEHSRQALTAEARANGSDRIVLGLRPEALELGSGGLSARVEVVEEVGADAHVFCSAQLDGEPTRLVARTAARLAPARGAEVTLRVRPDEAHLFDADSGVRLGT